MKTVLIPIIFNLLISSVVHAQANYSDPQGPIYKKDFSTSNSDPSSLKIVSYNIWFNKNLDQVTEVLKKESADVILLQEVDQDPRTKLNAAESIAQALQMN